MCDCTTPATYTLVDPTGIFTIDTTSGYLSIVHAEYLSIADVGTRFNLSVMAHVGTATPASVNVVVNVIVSWHRCPPPFTLSA
jgi:hypothetical protein